MNARRFRPRPAGYLPVAVLAAGACALLLATPASTAAQAPEGVYRISQRASVSQNLGNAVISLDYSRPLVRGRTDLFGKVVHWGELWTPGANEATVLEVNEEVKLNGHAVPEGRWSMWIIPSQVGPWELVLDARDELFHTQRPELSDEQILFVVDAEHDAAHVEALTWTFTRISHDGGTLQMNWGTTQIALAVQVESNKPVLTMAADEAVPYLGEWDVTFAENPETGDAMPPAVLTLRHAEDGSLVGSFPPGVFGPPEDAAAQSSDAEPKMTPQERERAEARRLLAGMGSGAFEFVLVPRAHGVFLFGLVQDGELLEVEEAYHEFEFDGGRAVRLTIRSHDDRIFATATRR
jgi:hypothetical protein